MDTTTTKSLIGCMTGFIVAVLVMAVGIYVTGDIPGVPPWVSLPLWLVVAIVVAKLIPNKTAERIAEEEYDHSCKSVGFTEKTIDFLYGDKNGKG